MGIVGGSPEIFLVCVPIFGPEKINVSDVFYLSIWLYVGLIEGKRHLLVVCRGWLFHLFVCLEISFHYGNVPFCKGNSAGHVAEVL